LQRSRGESSRALRRLTLTHCDPCMRRNPGCCRKATVGVLPSPMDMAFNRLLMQKVCFLINAAFASLTAINIAFLGSYYGAHVGILDEMESGETSPQQAVLDLRQTERAIRVIRV